MKKTGSARPYVRFVETFQKRNSWAWRFASVVRRLSTVRAATVERFLRTSRAVICLETRENSTGSDW